MTENKLQRKLRARIAKGNLPIGYDIYNEIDINDISPTICAASYDTWSRAGLVAIFEVSEDE